MKLNLNRLNKEQTNSKKVEMFLFIIISFLVGILVGENFTTTNIITTEKKLSDKNLNKFIYNYEYILNNYYKELDEDELINNAIKGMTESLDDPYSVYMDESESNTFDITLNGTYEGLGIQIAQKLDNDDIIVAGILKGSPAADSDLKVGDVIISINDKLASEMTTNEFSNYVTTSNEKKYTLKILRDEKELTIVLNKAGITLTSVTSEIIKNTDKKIGYIYIGIFANNTYEQFKSELDNLEKENIDALIIDVRGNSGGHLTAVDEMLDIFLNSKQIMYQFEYNGKIEKTFGTGNEKKKPYEIVFLADKNSASASEVLISGLKDNFGYKLIGEKTYGKGSVQELIDLTGGDQYKITTKRWLTPNSKCLTDEGGIAPDIEVILSDEYYDTYEQKDDNQLQEAIKYIEELK